LWAPCAACRSVRQRLLPSAVHRPGLRRDRSLSLPPLQDFFDVVRSADDAARAGRMDEALEMYDLAAKLARGHGLPFTRKAVVQLRRAFGEPPAPRARAAGRAAIAMSALGSYGQFGNQLLQYAFLRLYAQEHG